MGLASKRLANGLADWLGGVDLRENGLVRTARLNWIRGLGTRNGYVNRFHELKLWSGFVGWLREQAMWAGFVNWVCELPR